MASLALNALRKRSNYPAFRIFINFIAGIGYLIALALIVVGALALSRGDSLANPTGAVLLVGGGLLVAFFALVGTEVSSMVADIADCAVNQLEHRAPAAGNHETADTRPQAR